MQYSPGTGDEHLKATLAEERQDTVNLEPMLREQLCTQSSHLFKQYKAREWRAILLTYPTTALIILCLLDILSPYDFIPYWLMRVASLLWVLVFFKGVILWRGQGELFSRLQDIQDEIEQEELARECVALNNAYIILERGIYCRRRLLWITGAVIYAVVVLAVPYVTGTLLLRRGDELMLASGTALVLLLLVGVIAKPLRRMRREIRARKPVLQAKLEQFYSSVCIAEVPEAAYNAVIERDVDYDNECNIRKKITFSQEMLVWNRQRLRMPRDRLEYAVNTLRSLAFTLCWMAAVASFSLTPAADPAGWMARLQQIALYGFTVSVALGGLWVWRKRALAYTVAADRR